MTMGAGTDPPSSSASASFVAQQAHARAVLDALTRLPPALALAGSTRELHDAVRAAVTHILGPVRALELFLVEGTSGAIVPSGEPQEGVPLLDALWAAGEPLTEQPALLAPSRSHGEILSIPIIDRTGTLGVLVVEQSPGGRRFRGADIDDLTLVGMQLTLALQRLHLDRRAAAHRRVERDLLLARQVQRRFLPGPPPPGLGFRLDAHYRPAHDVGGDFYDVHASSDALTVIVGDVAGRGVAAALHMSRLTADLRAIMADAATPLAVLLELDQVLAQADEQEQLVTCVCIRLHIDGTTTLANAGQVAPILRDNGGHARRIGLPSGAPLGVGAGWSNESFVLAPGEALFIATDGLAAALVETTAEHPGDALWRLVGDGPPELDLATARILHAVERRRMLGPLDDVTLVAVQRNA
jgi:sigma-B regulation protein RsbU (phosphoserine phosphatase)